MSVHPFDDGIALERTGEHVARGRTSAAYRNFIGPFGGLTAAQVLQSVLVHPQRLGDPVAFTVNFAAAIGDGDFEIEALPVRTNRSTQHWMITMRQQGEAMVTATALTAVRRETWSLTEAAMPEVPKPAEVSFRGTPPRVEWIKRYEMRFIEGAFPGEWNGEDSGISRTRLWVRDNPPRPLDFASLCSMSDAFFPRIVLRRASQVPLGTVSMTVYFHATQAALGEAGDGYLLGQVQGQGFGGGFFDHTAQLWSEAGTLMTTTHQVYYFKE